MGEDSEENGGYEEKLSILDYAGALPKDKVLRSIVLSDSDKYIFYRFYDR